MRKVIVRNETTRGGNTTNNAAIEPNVYVWDIYFRQFLVTIRGMQTDFNVELQ